MDLPNNFYYIPLSKKEVDRVKGRLGQDWDPASAMASIDDEHVEQAEHVEQTEQLEQLDPIEN